MLISPAGAAPPETPMMRDLSSRVYGFERVVRASQSSRTRIQLVERDASDFGNGLPDTAE